MILDFLYFVSCISNFFFIFCFLFFFFFFFQAEDGIRDADVTGVQTCALPISGTEELPAVTINYGAFIQTVVDFLIISFSVFMVVKGMNNLKKKEAAAPATPAAPPAPSKEEVLLTEIRDLLKNKS